jgi:hypothetical protein
LQTRSASSSILTAPLLLLLLLLVVGGMAVAVAGCWVTCGVSVQWQVQVLQLVAARG